MKQRLLLSLLMLFVSVGFAVGQDSPVSITIPEHTDKGNVTIVLSSEKSKFVPPTTNNIGSYPVISGYSSDGKVAVTASTVTYTIPYGEKQTLSLATGYNPDWGSIAISISGKVSEFKATGDGTLLKNLTSLSFEGNGELKNLILGAGGGTMAYVPNLGYLDCQGNQLSRSANYKIGEQTPSGITFTGITGNAKTGVMLDATTAFAGWNNAPSDITGLSFVELKDANNNVVTSHAVQDATTPNKYIFKNGGIYVDGNYTAKIKIESETCPGVIICGVPVTVSAAQFTLTVTSSGHGTINADPASGTATLVKGQTVTLTPIPEDGYTFKEFTDIKGLTFDRKDGNAHYYKVTGNEDPKINATFQAGNSTITITQPQNGRIEVLDEDGNQVSAPEVGSNITIRVESYYGYEVAKVYNGDTEIADEETERADYFEAKMKVPAEGLKLSAVMTEKKSDLTIAYKGTQGAVKKTFVTVNGQEKKHTNNVYSDIPYNASVRVEFVLTNSTDKITLVCGSAEQPLRKTVNNGDVAWVLDEYKMPTEDTRMVATITPMNSIKVTVAEADKTMTYDGTKKAIKYTVEPNGLEGFKVEYKVSTDPDDAYTEEKFTAAGSYKARITREADATHAAIEPVVVNYTIEKADVVITDEPTVEVVEVNGSKAYKVSGGKAAYMRDGQPIDITDQGEFFTEQVYDADATAVTVQFQPKDENNLNVASVNVTLAGDDVKEYTVKIDPSSEGILTMWNGSAQVKSDATVLEGTTITFKITPEDGLEATDYEVVQLDGEGNIVSTGDLSNGVKIGTHGDLNATTLIFRADLKSTVNQQELALANKDNIEQKVTYDGTVQSFDYTKLNVVIKETGAPAQGGIWTVSYTLDGQTVAEPTNAGTYDVLITRDATPNAKRFEVVGTLVIEQAKLDEAGINVPTPTASRINIGQPLYYSNLTGSADIAGYYQWDVTSYESVMESKPYPVIFYPQNSNYEPLKLKEQVTVPLTDATIITWYDPDNYGYVRIQDATGKEYYSGDAVKEGTVLTITAIPYDEDNFELESLNVDGYAIANGGKYTFGKKSVEISVFFKPKSTEVIDPNSQYSVTVTESVRGAIISHPGENVVKKGGSFTFTVSTLAADANKVSVTATNGRVSKGSNGRYTVSNIQANTTVRVSLSNPTALKVDIKESYLNDKKYHIGYVEIADGEASSYYYGDEITVVAYPESGVKFKGWSNGSTDQVLDLVLTGDLTLTASFTGTPTGIEDIETAKVYTGKGFIMVKNVANAEVTVVSISGRLQAKREISGDTQIMVPQGIYVVVLQSGDDTKQLKVIVK